MNPVLLIGLTVWIAGFVVLAAFLYTELVRDDRNGMYPPSAPVVVGLLLAALLWPVSLVVGCVALLVAIAVSKLMEAVR